MGHALRVFRIRTLAIQYPDPWGKPAIPNKENSPPCPGWGRWGLTLIGASNNLYCYRHCGCPVCVCVCVCVCVSVRSFLPLSASRSQNIGTFVFTATRKTLYIAIIIVIFAENASLRLRPVSFACLEMPLTAPELLNTDTNGIHATWA